MGSDLADMIMADLQDGGMATVEDIADAIDYPIASVVAKMQEMARRGQIYRRTFYAVNERDFVDGVDE
jgi:DNA-binding MarR family transcriptional regulator